MKPRRRRSCNASQPARRTRQLQPAKRPRTLSGGASRQYQRKLAAERSLGLAIPFELWGCTMPLPYNVR